MIATPKPLPTDRRHNRKYPWDEWFLLDCFRLVRGRHYAVSQSSIEGQLRNSASKRGLKVQVVDEGTAVVVRVLRGGADAEAC